MIGNIQALDNIRTRCSRGLPLPAELRRFLAEALGRYLEQDCGSLNEAFGVIQGHGGLPWWREQAIRERDAALTALSRNYFANQVPGKRAREVSRLSRRYASACWPRDRALDAMPAHYRGSPNEHLWRAFKSRAKMPISERHLRTLLGD